MKRDVGGWVESCEQCVAKENPPRKHFHGLKTFLSPKIELELSGIIKLNTALEAVDSKVAYCEIRF